MCEPSLNLAWNLLLKDGPPWTGDFRPMVSSAVWVKRLRRDNRHVGGYVFLELIGWTMFIFQPPLVARRVEPARPPRFRVLFPNVEISSIVKIQRIFTPSGVSPLGPPKNEH